MRLLLTALALLLPFQVYSYTNTNVYVSDLEDETVMVIDSTTNLIISNIPVGNHPWKLSVSPNGTEVYCVNNYSNNASVISTASNTVIATITTGMFPLDVKFAPNGVVSYILNNLNDNVSVIHVASRTVIATVTVGTQPESIAFTPNGRTVFATNNGPQNISVIDVTTHTVVATVTTNLSSMGDVCVSKDGTKAYIASEEVAGKEIILDVTTNILIATITVGNTPRGCAISPTDPLFYVSNQVGNDLSIINTTSDVVVNTLSGLSAPLGIAFLADGKTAYVVNVAAESLSVIDVGTTTVVATITLSNLSLINSVYVATCPPPFPSELLQVEGLCKKNIFLTHEEIIISISWQRSTFSLDTLQYKIYRDAALTDLISTIPAWGPFIFEDHNRKPKVAYTYYVVEEDEDEFATAVGSVTVECEK